MNTKNKDKCKGRREAIKIATPTWLTQEHKDMIKRLYDYAKALNESGKTKYHVDHIVPLNHPLACGLHVPWNLQILDEVDNKKKGNRLDTEPIKGAITVETLINSDNMGIRYRGKFLKGSPSPNPEGRPTDLEKASDIYSKSFDDEGAFAKQIKQLSDEYESDAEFAENAASLLIRSAKTPIELYKYLKDFMPYYQPKMASNEKSDIDKEITITILRPDENKS